MLSTSLEFAGHRGVDAAIDQLGERLDVGVDRPVVWHVGLALEKLRDLGALLLGGAALV